MKKRHIIQTIIILLLLLLLSVLAAPSLQKTKKFKRLGPDARKERLKDAPLSLRESVMEQPLRDSTSAAEEEKSMVEPISHSGWVNNGAYEVFGEVQNKGVIVARQVRVNLTFKDGNWNRLGRIEVPVDRPTLVPGAKSPFKAVFRTNNPERVGSYVIIVGVAR